MIFKNKFQNLQQEDTTPETSYKRARQEYDLRCGTAKAAAANWRLLSFGLLGLCFLGLAGSFYFASRSTLVPYIVEVDNQSGAIISTSKVYERSQPNQREKEYFAWQVIKKARTLPKDIIVYKTNWQDVYAFLDDASSQKFNDMAVREKHKDKLQKGVTTMLQLKQITQLSSNDATYNVRWTEVHYEGDGKKAGEYDLEAYVTIQQYQPTEETIYTNPLGLIIKDFSMSKVRK